jgi:hypothetical protein
MNRTPLIYVKITEFLDIIDVSIHASFVLSSGKFWSGSEAKFP